jgi:hypothetical protein
LTSTVIAPPSHETIGFHVAERPLSELDAVSSAEGAAQATAKSGRRKSEAVRFMGTLGDYGLKFGRCGTYMSTRCAVPHFTRGLILSAI